MFRAWPAKMDPGLRRDTKTDTKTIMFPGAGRGPGGIAHAKINQTDAAKTNEHWLHPAATSTIIPATYGEAGMTKPMSRRWLALSLPLMPLLSLPALGMAAQQAPAGNAAAGNAAAGARQYLQCRACHTVAPGGAHGTGPNLAGIMGARAGSKPGYAYSPAMKGAAFTWTAAEMDAFLAKPNARLPGNKMAFAGMPSAAARRDLIAYLATLKGK
jgi:cytochrome c